MANSGGDVDLGSLRIDDAAREKGGRGFSLRSLAVAAAVLVLAAAVAVGVASRKASVEVAVAREVEGGGSATLLTASGYVTPRRRATVAAKITARVVEMIADEGMQVASGQVLARLDASDAGKRLATVQAGLDVARASVGVLEVSLANAERELARQRELERDGVSSEQALDLARTSRDSLVAELVAARNRVREAEASVAAAQHDVENCTVRAPFAGIVVSKDAQPGEMVSPVSAGSGYTRTGIATVVDMESLEIEVDVSESYIAKVRPAQRAEARLDAYPDWGIPASVRTVIPTADRQKATVKVRLSFDQLDPRILPDMGVKVAFLSESDRAEAQVKRVLVPRAAIRDEGERTVVFVVNEGRVVRRAVRQGADRGGEVEVLAGLEAGDTVVVDGPPTLRDGQRVKVK